MAGLSYDGQGFLLGLRRIEQNTSDVHRDTQEIIRLLKGQGQVSGERLRQISVNTQRMRGGFLASHGGRQVVVQRTTDVMQTNRVVRQASQQGHQQDRAEVSSNGFGRERDARGRFTRQAEDSAFIKKLSDGVANGVKGFGVDDRNLDPLLDSLHEIKGVLSPVGKVVAVIGKMGVWTANKMFRLKKREPLPRQQAQHYAEVEEQLESLNRHVRGVGGHGGGLLGAVGGLLRGGGLLKGVGLAAAGAMAGLGGGFDVAKKANQLGEQARAWVGDVVDSVADGVSHAVNGAKRFLGFGSDVKNSSGVIGGLVHNTTGRQYRPVKGGLAFKGFGGRVDGLIKEASQYFGIDEKMLRGLVKMEAGWTGAMSSTGAIGIGQFTKGTWDDLARTKAGKDIGMTVIGSRFRTANDPRRDMRVNMLATALLAKQNANDLIRSGIEADGGNLYMAHNMGVGFVKAIHGKARFTKNTRYHMDVNNGRGMTPQQFIRYQQGRYWQHYADANGVHVGVGGLGSPSAAIGQGVGHLAKASSGQLVIGDSIAFGYANARRLGNKYTKVGANPSAILGYVQDAIKANNLNGKMVTLSTGLSNNRKDYASIDKQLFALKQAGAVVRVMGVANNFLGSAKNGAVMNGELGKLAARYGFEFLGGFDASQDKVHPKSYANLYGGVHAGVSSVPSVVVGGKGGRIYAQRGGKKELTKDNHLYDAIMQEAYSKYGFTPQEQLLLKAQIWSESGFNPRVGSHKGAYGLAQFMPATARQYGVDVKDPRSSIFGQARLMASLKKRYHGDMSLALAAYNAGAGNVAKYGNKIPPFKETQNYVRDILANTGVFRFKGSTGVRSADLRVSGLPSVAKMRIPPSPTISQTLGGDKPKVMMVHNQMTIGQNVSDRGIAHAITGGLGMDRWGG